MTQNTETPAAENEVVADWPEASFFSDFVTGTNSFFQFLEGGLDYIFGKIESVGEASRHSTNFKITRMFSDSDAEAASRMNPDNWLIPSDVRASIDFPPDKRRQQPRAELTMSLY